MPPPAPRPPRRRTRILLQIWSAFLVLLVLLYVVVLFRLPRGPKSRRVHGRYAYATVLCNEELARATLVLVRSLQRTQSPYSIVVVTTANVSRSTIIALNALGAKVHNSEQLLPSLQTQSAEHKECACSKLLVWGLVKYKKIVYLDSSILVLKNIDNLLELPELSAASSRILPHMFDTGVMVLRPSKATLTRMMETINSSINNEHGLEEFLNSFFSGWSKQTHGRHLPSGDNAYAGLGSSSSWNLWVHPQLRVLHYDGTSKPWNMRRQESQDVAWGEGPVDGRWFDGLWWRALEEVEAHLHSLLPNGSSAHPNPACQPVSVAKVKPMKSGCSILLDATDGNVTLLKHALAQYMKMRVAHKVFIFWGGPPSAVEKALVPTESGKLKKGVTARRGKSRNAIEVLNHSTRSGMERFGPVAGLETDCVLLADTSTEVPEASVNTAYRSWFADQLGLVGFYPAAHYWSGNEQIGWVYVERPHAAFSMLLTRMVLVHRRYLHAFTCQSPPALLEYVSAHPECQDVMFNVVASHLSKRPPLIVLETSKQALGPGPLQAKGIALTTSLSTCLNKAQQLMGYMPLANSTEAISFFWGDSQLLSRFDERAHVQPKPMWMIEPDDVMRFMPAVRNTDLTLEVSVIPSAWGSGNRILCVQGNDSSVDGTSRNRYMLVERTALPSRAVKHAGTTYIMSSRWDYQSFFPLYSSFGQLFQFQEQERAGFGPSRILLYRHGGLVTSVTGNSLALMQALFGDRMLPMSLPSGSRPHCLEKVALVRQSSFSLSGRLGLMARMRRKIWEHCQWRTSKSARESAGGQEAPGVLQILLVTHRGRHIRGRLENSHELRNAIHTGLCRPTGKCIVAPVPYGSSSNFCDQVMTVRAADILVGAHGEGLHYLSHLLPEHAVVLEIVSVDDDAEITLVDFMLEEKAQELGLIHHQMPHLLSAVERLKGPKGTLPAVSPDARFLLERMHQEVEALRNQRDVKAQRGVDKS